jgi:hypothetical protein
MTRRIRLTAHQTPIAIAAFALAVAALHIATPAGPHTWHFLHLIAQKLYFVPIPLAAARRRS